MACKSCFSDSVSDSRFVERHSGYVVTNVYVVNNPTAKVAYDITKHIL